jgi:hypothetical protein
VPADFRGQALAAVAARVGTTRLIDNVELSFPELSLPEPDLTDAVPVPRSDAD